MLLSGFNPADLFLRMGWPSKKGLLILAITTPLTLPDFLTGTWAGWQTIPFLVYAPATAIGQELFFRCALFPMFLRLLPGRPSLAIFIAALLGLWHVGPIVSGAAWFVALSVMAVPILGGLAWNWQVRQDHTVIWVVIYHLLIDQSMSLFTWPD